VWSASLAAGGDGRGRGCVASLESMRPLVLFLILAALPCASCGGRSSLDLASGEPLGDAAGPAVVTLDDASAPDTGPEASFDDVSLIPPPDASMSEPDSPCSASTPAVLVGQGGNGCKFDVTWTCGGDAFQAGGDCTTPPDGSTGGTYGLNCEVNGKLTRMFAVSTTACLCDDPVALGAFAVMQCQ